jgi:hypothetical protein
MSVAAAAAVGLSGWAAGTTFARKFDVEQNVSVYVV